MPVRAPVLLLLLLGAPAYSTAQEKIQQPVPTIKTDVREVLVPVVVTDKSGHYITDLSARDFDVMEDGTRQQIVAFSKSMSPLAAAASVATSGGQTNHPAPVALNVQAAPQRTYLVCVDALHSSFGNFNAVRTALKKFFEQEQDGDAQYVLITLGREAHVVIDSTRDPSTVLTAITSKSFAKNLGESESSSIALERERFQDFMRLRYCSACACLNTQANTTDGPTCPAIKEQAKQYLLSYGERAYILNKDFLQNLEQIVHGMARIPTYRTIVFLSDGFNRFPGRELYAILKGYGPKDHSFGFNPRDLQPDLDRVLEIAEQYDVRFYTLDSRGLYAPGSIDGTSVDAAVGPYSPASLDSENNFAARENGDVMAELAQKTGGLFFENSNDLLKGIRRAFADGRAFYVLAYVPANSTLDGKFRKIDVQVKDRKLHVTAKAGYWATPR